MAYVIDPSVALAWLLPDETNARAATVRAAVEPTQHRHRSLLTWCLLHLKAGSSGLSGFACLAMASGQIRLVAKHKLLLEQRSLVQPFNRLRMDVGGIDPHQSLNVCTSPIDAQKPQKESSGPEEILLKRSLQTGAANDENGDIG